MRRLTAALAAAGACLMAGHALGQAYPAKAVRLLIPYSAGGPTDLLARAIAPKLAEAFGQSVVVENRLGAGGGVAMDAVAKAAPDGYLIGVGLTGTHSINPHLYAKLPYDPLKDFTPITPIVSYVNVLVVNAAVQARSVAELVAQAKASAGGMAYASGGKGASNHLSGELLRVVTGAPLVHVPYKGNGPAMTDVIAGNVPFMFDILGTALPQIRSGKVRALAVTSAKRSQYAPEIPTMKESGVAGYEEAGSDLWMGVFAPPATPRPVVDRLNAEIVKAMHAPDVAERVKAYAYDTWTLSPEEFAAHLRIDNAKWGRVVKQAGITPE
jgi:tripartite-type tricarboxylate transporter receptor subunit TctC